MPLKKKKKRENPRYVQSTAISPPTERRDWGEEGVKGRGEGGEKEKKNFLASNTVALALSRILSL